MKSKRLLACLIAVSLMVTSAACSNGGGTTSSGVSSGAQSTNSATAPSDAGEKITLTLWHHELASYRVEAWQKVIDSFNEANPNIEVIQEPILWSDAMPKMLSASQAGTLPDMNQAADSQWSTTYLAGSLIPVDDIFEEIDEKEHFSESSVKSYKIDGHIWGIPISSNALSVIYRPSILKELGYDTFPETWSEFEEYLEKATLDENGDGVPERYGIALPGSRCTEHNDNFLAWLATMDNGIFDENGNVAFNNPDTVRTADFFANTLMKKFAPPNILSMDAGEMILNFTGGNVATMVFLFPDLVTAFKENDKDVATAPLPRPDDVSAEQSKRLLTNHAMNVTVAAQEPERYEACKKFLKYLLEPENIWIVTCGQEPGFFFPPTETGMQLINEGYFNQDAFPLENFDYSEGSEDRKMFLEESKVVAGYNATDGFAPGNRFGPVNLAATEINGSFVIADMVHKIVADNMPVEEAVEWAQNTMQTISNEVNG